MMAVISGGNTHVTPFNMMLYLGLVERRCVDLVNRCAALERGAKRHNKSLPLGSPILEYEKNPTTEAPPSIEKMVPGQPCPL